MEKSNEKIGILRKVTSTVTGKKFLAGNLRVEDDMGTITHYDIRVIPNNNKRDEKDVDFFIFGDPFIPQVRPKEGFDKQLKKQENPPPEQKEEEPLI